MFPAKRDFLSSVVGIHIDKSQPLCHLLSFILSFVNYQEGVSIVVWFSTSSLSMTISDGIFVSIWWSVNCCDSCIKVQNGHRSKARISFGTDPEILYLIRICLRRLTASITFSNGIAHNKPEIKLKKLKNDRKVTHRRFDMGTIYPFKPCTGGDTSNTVTILTTCAYTLPGQIT